MAIMLKIIISKTSNFLSFYQKNNLSDNTIKNYIYNKNIDLLFYDKNKKELEKIREVFGDNKEYIQFKKELAMFKKDFNVFWAESSKDLSLWKNYFESKFCLFNEIINDIKNLCGVKHFLFSKIPVFLISYPCADYEEIKAWFSWTQKESFIVVEIPFGYKMFESPFPLSVLIHEFFHLLLRENIDLINQIKEKAEKKSELLKNKLNENMSNKMFLEELLISSFIPEGYLNEKYFNIEVINYNMLESKSLLSWRKFVAYKMKNMAKNYIDNKNQIDDEYLQKIISIVK